MKITSREEQILSLVAIGMNDRNIADFTGISVRTVHAHLARIYVKFNAKNRTEAVFRFQNSKFYKLPISFYSKSDKNVVFKLENSRN